MPFTKWLRAVQVERFMEPKENHLDIGCGDGYFLKRSTCRKCWGIDLLYGESGDKLAFPSGYFDYVTMLAVVEHLENPEEVFWEIHRVLKPGGRFIFTTPKKSGEWLMKLYSREVEKDHRRYFDLEMVKELSKGLFRLEAYNFFMIGYNQVFSLVKIIPAAVH
jgi:ubiquinone/menaquinone biosynthesis C-methylase UbiE